MELEMIQEPDYQVDDVADDEEVESKPSPQEFLTAALTLPNIVELIDDEALSDAVAKVVTEYEVDVSSRTKWLERIEAALDLAMMVAEEKNYPFEKASNVKYPLLTTAALQFNARSYPSIIQGNRVVKCQTWGDDESGEKAKRGDRVSEHLSYQMLSEMPEWEPDTDRMLVMLPILGCVFRKVYYDPALARKCSRLITPDRLVVNYHAQDLLTVPRITEEMFLYPHEIEERIRSGRFIEFEYEGNGGDEESEAADSSEPHCFLEQHRLLDLDQDGYTEPYIVTLHKPTQTIVRIVPNFDPETAVFDEQGGVISLRRQNYFVKYDFLPNPDGGFYGLGFGWLLKDIGESVNTTINQLLDAGHLSNIQGGFISAQAGIKEKSIRIKNGEWKVIKSNGPLAQSMQPITYPGPSATLFNLLGLLIESGKDLASIKDVLTGEQKSNQTATATLALIEQGLQVFTAIYKRVYRGIKAELDIHVRLNTENADPEQYQKFFDSKNEQADMYADYDLSDMDILPIADPNAVSKMQKLAKAQFVYEVAGQNPAVDAIEATRRMFEAAGIEDPDKLIKEQQASPQEQAVVAEMAGLEVDAKRLENEQVEADILAKFAKTMKDLADTEAKEEGIQLGQYKMILEAFKEEINAEQRLGQGGVRSVDGAPNNQMGSGQAGAPLGGPLGTSEGNALPVDGVAPAGLGEPTAPSGL